MSRTSSPDPTGTLVPFDDDGFSRFSRWWRRRGRRQVQTEEYSGRLDGSALHVDFHNERLVVGIQILTPDHARAEVVAVRVRDGDETRILRGTVETESVPGAHRVMVDLSEPTPTERLEVELEPDPIEGLNLTLWVRGEDPDRIHLALAEQALRQEKWRLALQRFRDYENDYTHLDPRTALGMARILQHLGESEEAAHQALRGFAGGAEGEGWRLYREVQATLEAADPEAIRRLQGEVAGWDAPSHKGTLILERTEHVTLAREGWSIRKSRSRIEIRRRAAARLLRGLDFSFDAGRESIVHTALRILHADDTVEEVPEGNFSITDSEHRNPFITVEDTKKGRWIVPDLEPGDVVEMVHHTLTRHHDARQRSRFFLSITPLHAGDPTFRSEVRFLVPPGVEPRFATRMLDGEPEEVSREDDWREWVYREERFVPRPSSGYAYETTHLRPLIACAAAGDTWADVARHGRSLSFGEEDTTEELPAVLAEIVDAEPDPVRGLALAYYWIRDRLKYASTATGNLNVGVPDRARRILEMGTGDCKDKSYLLGLVARRLDLPYEYVLVSSAAGTLFHELPGNQFDHVFIRVLVDGVWRYLDAANQVGTFGRVPPWLQGGTGLLLDGEGTLVPLPIDPPGENRIRVTETFSGIEGQWLRGSFVFEATGHHGREASERLKMGSLHLDDPRRAGQAAMENYIPYLLLHDHELEADTGDGDVFRVTGHHDRCHLVPLGDAGPRVGRLHWNAFLIPLNWRTVAPEGFHAHEVNTLMEIEVRLQGKVLADLRDTSHLEAVTNGICHVEESVTREDDALVLRRRIEIREKVVSGEMADQLPATFQAIEDASYLALAFARHPGE